MSDEDDVSLVVRERETVREAESLEREVSEPVRLWVRTLVAVSEEEVVSAVVLTRARARVAASLLVLVSEPTR